MSVKYIDKTISKLLLTKKAGYLVALELLPLLISTLRYTFQVYSPILFSFLKSKI